MPVQGWDISPTHAGVVQLDDAGNLQTFWTASTQPKVVKAAGSFGRLLDLSLYAKVLLEEASSEDQSVYRLRAWECFFAEVLGSGAPAVVAMEDYATHEAFRAHQTGEVGGLARVSLLRYGCRFRLHDPVTLKLYATGSGSAQKDEVAAAVKQRWGADFTGWDPQVKTTKRRSAPETVVPIRVPKTLALPSYDLCDAYVLAQMALIEIRLRSGAAQMSDLREHEIRAFNRVTKVYPVNLLARDWLQGK